MNFMNTDSKIGEHEARLDGHDRLQAMLEKTLGVISEDVKRIAENAAKIPEIQKNLIEQHAELKEHDTRLKGLEAAHNQSLGAKALSNTLSGAIGAGLTCIVTWFSSKQH